MKNPHIISSLYPISQQYFTMITTVTTVVPLRLKGTSSGRSRSNSQSHGGGPYENGFKQPTYWLNRQKHGFN